MKYLLDNKEKIIACLIVACLIWLIKGLSQLHMTTICFPVAYQNLPNDRIITNQLPDQLTLAIKAKGTELLRYKYKYWSEQTLKIDYADYQGESRIRTKELVESFSTQLKNVDISGITPRLIHLAFEKKMSKQIPLVVPLQLSVDQNFEIVDTTIMPKHVVATGPISLIDTMSFWQTDSLRLDKITQTQVGQLNLKKAPTFTLQFSKQQVHYTITVEEFTEKALMVPITEINVPDSLNVVLSKSQVEVQFQVSINDFQNIESNAFAVIADFATVDIFNEATVPLYLTDTLPIIKNLRITPAQVDYHLIIDNHKQVMDSNEQPTE